LVGGFSHELWSMPLINAAINEQNTQIANGNAGPFAPMTEVVEGLDLIDHGSGGNPPWLNPVDHTIFQISPVEP